MTKNKSYLVNIVRGIYKYFFNHLERIREVEGTFFLSKGLTLKHGTKFSDKCTKHQHSHGDVILNSLPPNTPKP